ncbi:MAG: DUF1194 domain-containing protein [Alphaproteobacteria bacterium]|nr:DUF1194 domain-containing protein [Alphaproteobacteria bacterium]
MLRRILAALAAALAFTFAQPMPVAATPIDLVLVLAVDVSANVDSVDFQVQMDGYSAVFRSPKVHAANTAAGHRGVAVATVHWSDAGAAKVAITWRVLRDAASAQSYGELVAGTARQCAGHLTAIGSAIDFAADMIEPGLYTGRRKVIDVSGDGRLNHGVPPAEARDRAVARGITINDLLIFRVARLDAYYRDNVVGGDNAFVETIKGFRDLAEGILRKLILEISSETVS